MAERVCLACGAPVVGRADKKFCGSTCRQRGARGQVVHLPSENPVEQPLLSTVDETRRELEDADRLKGHLAASALRLARKIDVSESSVGYAPLVAQLQSTMALALAGANKAASRIDDLKARRDAKRAG